MDTSHQTTASGPKELVLRALESANEPMDSYQLAKVAGVTPTQVRRTLAKLALKGIVFTEDPLGTENDLSARYRLVSEAG